MGSELVILLDTHAWLWWLSEPSRLGCRSAARMEEELAGGSIVVSAISAWEAAILVRKGRLELRVPVSELVRACTRLPSVRFVDVTPTVALASVDLDDLHADPVDRMIVATALHEGADLITKDARLQAWPHVATLW
jgi:PIN domain nuclease of toxin-antitoxin system